MHHGFNPRKMGPSTLLSLFFAGAIGLKLVNLLLSLTMGVANHEHPIHGDDAGQHGGII